MYAARRWYLLSVSICFTSIFENDMFGCAVGLPENDVQLRSGVLGFVEISS